MISNYMMLFIGGVGADGCAHPDSCYPQDCKTKYSILIKVGIIFALMYFLFAAECPSV